MPNMQPSHTHSHTHTHTDTGIGPVTKWQQPPQQIDKVIKKCGIPSYPAAKNMQQNILPEQYPSEGGKMYIKNNRTSRTATVEIYPLRPIKMIS